MKHIANFAAPLAALFMTSGCATRYCGPCGPENISKPSDSIKAAGLETESQINSFVGRAQAGGFSAVTARQTRTNEDQFFAGINDLKAKVSNAIPDVAGDSCAKKVVVNHVGWAVRDKLLYDEQKSAGSFLSESWYSFSSNCPQDTASKEKFEESLRKSSQVIQTLGVRFGN